MTKPICHILTGLPASGKSTFAKTLNGIRFNLDDMRSMAGFGIENRDKWTREKENSLKEAMILGAIASIENGQDVILDNTFLTPKFPKSIREKMQGRVTFKVHSFLDVPIETCIERDKNRELVVGETTIRKLHKNYAGASKNGWILNDDWMNLWPNVSPANMNPRNPFTIICDLDGTLALHVSRGPFEMHKLETDALNIPVFEILFRFWMQGTKVVLLSGRDEGICRDSTVRWLKSHKVNYDELFMRPAGDLRPDYLIKYELFKKYVEPNFWVDLCFDDRDQCVALWRQLRLTCFQVNYGNF